MPEPDDDKHQDAKTLAGLAVAVVLVALTVFLLIELKHGTALLDCIAAGHKNCAPVNTSNM